MPGVDELLCGGEISTGERSMFANGGDQVAIGEFSIDSSKLFGAECHCVCSTCG
jgi:hypothetical protein